MKTFVLGWFLMLTAMPIAITLHYFLITKLPYLTSEDYRGLINLTCFTYALFQNITGFIVSVSNSSKL
jgi:hypothetical protein